MVCGSGRVHAGAGMSCAYAGLGQASMRGRMLGPTAVREGRASATASSTKTPRTAPAPRTVEPGFMLLLSHQAPSRLHPGASKDSEAAQAALGWAAGAEYAGVGLVRLPRGV